MGSPLSPILSNIYMELAEFYHILPHPLLNNSLWIRYVDDIFVSLPHNTNPNDVLNYINSIHPSVQYTIEMPSNNSIPFLDTLITWNNNYLQFTIYRKPTFAPNYIHWLSNHSPNTKLAVLSSLFLRAFRICSPPLLAQETKYIHNTFKSLYYPEFFITKAFNKAKKRYYSTFPPKNSNTSFLPIPQLPLYSLKQILPKNITLIPSNNITLKNILKPPKRKENLPQSCIYHIPCNTCNKTYIGETIDLQRRKNQHTDDLHKDSINSALTSHRRNTGHSININNIKMIRNINHTNHRKIMESFCIYNSNNYNKHPGEVKIDFIQNEYLKTSKYFNNTMKKIADQLKHT